MKTASTLLLMIFMTASAFAKTPVSAYKNKVDSLMLRGHQPPPDEREEPLNYPVEIVPFMTDDQDGSLLRYRESGGGGLIKTKIMREFESFKNFLFETRDVRVHQLFDNYSETGASRWLSINSQAAKLLMPGSLDIAFIGQNSTLNFFTEADNGWTFRAKNLTLPTKVLEINEARYFRELRRFYGSDFDGETLMHEFLRLINVNDEGNYFSRRLYPLYLEWKLLKANGAQ